MCTKEDCTRHEYDYGLCLPHLKEKMLGDKSIEPRQPPRKKKIDVVEVVVADRPLEQIETREDEESEESTDESA